MCMEDLKIGRNSQAAQIDRTISVVSQQAVSPDPYRTTLIFCPPSAGTAFFAMGDLAVAGFGIPILAGIDPVTLSIAEHGAMVRRGWSVVASAGTPTLSIFTNSYPYGEQVPLPPR